MTTSKRRITIEDDYGQHVAAVYAPADSHDLDGADIGAICHMFSKSLRGRSLRQSNLYGSVLKGSDLTDCRFDGADMGGAVLDDAILVGASLLGTNLAKASLSGTDLRGARYDFRTVFPVGFSPQSAGMIEEMTANWSSERTRGP